MNRRTRYVLLGGVSAVAAAVVLSVLSVLPALSVALALGGATPCKFGFSTFAAGCRSWSRTSTTTRSHDAEPGSVDKMPWLKPGSVDKTSLQVVDHCPPGPLGSIGKRLFCAAPGATPADLAVELSETTGLPLPKGRVVTTEKNSPLITSVHVEAPLDLAAMLGFYRGALGERGWTERAIPENDGAVVAPDRAVVAFTTADGPALLRLIHRDGRTIADLSLRKPAAADGSILPRPGQVRLMLGNTTDDEAVVTINARTIRLAPGAKLPDSPEIDLPPGRFKVALTVASSAAQNREFEVGADETWGLLVGPDGVPLPVHLY